jgi:hypothetical protein
MRATCQHARISPQSPSSWPMPLCSESCRGTLCSSPALRVAPCRSMSLRVAPCRSVSLRVAPCRSVSTALPAMNRHRQVYLQCGAVLIFFKKKAFAKSPSLFPFLSAHRPHIWLKALGWGSIPDPFRFFLAGHPSSTPVCAVPFPPSTGDIQWKGTILPHHQEVMRSWDTETPVPRTGARPGAVSEERLGHWDRHRPSILAASQTALKLSFNRPTRSRPARFVEVVMKKTCLLTVQMTCTT